FTSPFTPSVLIRDSKKLKRWFHCSTDSTLVLTLGNMMRMNSDILLDRLPSFSDCRKPPSGRIVFVYSESLSRNFFFSSAVGTAPPSEGTSGAGAGLASSGGAAGCSTETGVVATGVAFVAAISARTLSVQI